MIRIPLMLCAQGVIRDAQTNNISVFNILEEFTPFGLPALIPEMAVLTVLDREENDPPRAEGSLRITLSGEQLFSQNLDIDFQGRRRTRSIYVIGGLPMPTSGIMAVRFVCGDTTHVYEIVVNAPRPRTEQRQMPLNIEV